MGWKFLFFLYLSSLLSSLSSLPLSLGIDQMAALGTDGLLWIGGTTMSVLERRRMPMKVRTAV